MAAEGNRRTADVRCSGFTNLFILSKNEFEAAMKDYPAAHKLLKKRAKYAVIRYIIRFIQLISVLNNYVNIVHSIKKTTMK